MRPCRGSTVAILITGALIGGTGSSLQADSLGVDFSEGPCSVCYYDCSRDCTVGYAFTVNQATTVDALGVWDFNSSGFGENHPVGLWTATGTLIAATTVTNTSIPVPSADTRGRWLFTSIAPRLLTPGQYVTAAFYSAYSDGFAAYDISVTAPGIALGDAREATTGSLTYPSTVDSFADPGWFGPSFEIASSVPESSPAALDLLGFALIAVLIARARAGQADRA